MAKYNTFLHATNIAYLASMNIISLGLFIPYTIKQLKTKGSEIRQMVGLR